MNVKESDTDNTIEHNKDNDESLRKIWNKQIKFEDASNPAINIDLIILRAMINKVKIENKHLSNADLQVLSIKDDKGTGLNIPNTILKLGETSDEAIHRILGEDLNGCLNYNDMYIEQLYTLDNNTSLDKRGHIVHIVYFAIISNDTEIRDENDGIHWESVNVEQYENEQSVLESNGNLRYKIIHDSIIRIRKGLLKTDIGFNFVGKEFTISNLEMIFQVINGRSIPGFRRVIADKIEKTGKKCERENHRPAELFKKKS